MGSLQIHYWLYASTALWLFVLFDRANIYWPPFGVPFRLRLLAAVSIILFGGFVLTVWNPDWELPLLGHYAFIATIGLTLLGLASEHHIYWPPYGLPTWFWLGTYMTIAVAVGTGLGLWQRWRRRDVA